MATNTVNQVPLTGWRAKAAAMAQEVREIIEAAQEASEADSVSDQLLEFAGRHAEAVAQAASLPNTARSDVLGDVYGLEALLNGAVAVPDVTKAAKLLTAAALKLCDGASEYLDRSDGAEAPECGDSAQPPSADGIAPPAAVSQAVEAFGNESAGALWQMAMDEACNTDPHDGEEGITRVIALLGALKPYLVGTPDHDPAKVHSGAALAEDMEERAALACKAASEAHSLAALVRKAIEDEESNQGTRDAVHSMLLRIQRLSCCVLTAVDDSVATVDDVREQMSAA